MTETVSTPLSTNVATGPTTGTRAGQPVPSAQLLRDIEAFDIDGPERGPLPFAARLAQENGWTRAHAERVIREYKRFMYLCATHGRPVCPSQAVDEAWHAHLTYTRSYWERFCGGVLGREIHHDPTRGGSAEDAKHWLMYEDTLAAYQRAFNEAPPGDIWLPPHRRFAGVTPPSGSAAAKAGQSRLQWTYGLILAAPFVAVVLAGGNPFELVGGKFLLVLVPAFCAAIFIGRHLHRTLRAPKASLEDGEIALDWQEAAFVSGGAARLAAAAMARLAEVGAAAVSSDGSRLEPTGQKPADLSPVEVAVLAHLPVKGRGKGNQAAFQAINEAVTKAYALPIRSLIERGLIGDPKVDARAHRMAILPLAAVMLLLAVPRLFAGLSAGRPVGFLLATMAIFGIGGYFWVRTAKAGSGTPKADAAMNGLRQRNEPLRQGPQIGAEADAVGGTTSAALAVALFGTAVLAGSSVPALSALDDFYPRRTTEVNSGGGCGSSSSSSGGSGCGGGGCGGGGCGGG